MNALYILVIFLLLLYTYVYDIMACQWKLNVKEDTLDVSIVLLYFVCRTAQSLLSVVKFKIVDRLLLFVVQNRNLSCQYWEFYLKCCMSFY